jgi:hypothetical protein
VRLPTKELGSSLQLTIRRALEAAEKFGTGQDRQGLKRVCEFPAKRTAGPPVTLRSASEERSVEFGTKDFGGLRPSFSAHVRWCEHGAPVRSCGDLSRLKGKACGIPHLAKN